ncbi:hypothetical protein [Nocardioides sp. URHA0020]|uniref:hypothetical protein n=1 Tax=Nocardioides sp. URHA0020 TaxID=1380392 RepID=UPI00048E2BF6|nr:hypothetical protein [Nocardioides sp. URHA0020]
MNQDDDPSTTDPTDAVGSVAEEAVKLLGALSSWAQDAAPDLDAHLATGSTECTYCPICRTVHLVRELRPEVREQLATAATTALQALSGLLVAATPDARRSPGGVEHIDLDDTGDWPDEPDVRTDPEEGDR